MIAIGVFFAYVRPVWIGPIAATKAAITADEEALSAAKQYTQQQNELASARAAIHTEDLSRLTTFLPDSVDNVGLILDLNALAARSGLSLSNVDVTTDSNTTIQESSDPLGTPVSPISSVDLSLSAVGTYTALQNFLQDIERSQRLLDVRDLVVKGSGTGVYVYQMTVRLYWLH
jgi:Tfp pilus assembly protein PilO